MMYSLSTEVTHGDSTVVPMVLSGRGVVTIMVNWVLVVRKLLSMQQG